MPDFGLDLELDSPQENAVSCDIFMSVALSQDIEHHPVAPFL